MNTIKHIPIAYATANDYEYTVVSMLSILENSKENEIYDFYSLGMGDPIPVSGSHGIGIGDLLDEIIKNLDFTEEEFDIFAESYLLKPFKTEQMNLILEKYPAG